MTKGENYLLQHLVALLQTLILPSSASRLAEIAQTMRMEGREMGVATPQS
jgi:hypothetical protein